MCRFFLSVAPTEWFSNCLASSVYCLADVQLLNGAIPESIIWLDNLMCFFYSCRRHRRRRRRRLWSIPSCEAAESRSVFLSLDVTIYTKHEYQIIIGARLLMRKWDCYSCVFYCCWLRLMPLNCFFNLPITPMTHEKCNDFYPKSFVFCFIIRSLWHICIVGSIFCVFFFIFLSSVQLAFILAENVINSNCDPASRLT